MKMNTLYLFAFSLFGLVVACGETTPTETPVEEGVKNTETVTEENTAAPENTAETRIAELDKWKAFIETNSGSLMNVAEHKYDCQGWGGTVKFTNDNDMLRAVEHINGGEDGSEIKKFFFDETDQLVMAWHETSMWRGNSNTTVQTTYYIKDGAAFKATQKEVTGTSPETIEANLASATGVDAGTEGFVPLNVAANELMGLTGDQVQDHFCN
jgi:hypothetical protein